MRISAQRIATVASMLALLAGGTVHCVGDAPASDAADASVSDASSDTSVGTDASSGADSGPDASVDPCKGFTNCPAHVSASHLALWLRGDIVQCAGGHVTRWTDLSGHGRDAIPQPFLDGGTAATPRCGVDQLNGRSVVTFDAPAQSDPPFYDGTLTVDLSFLAGTGFSIFIVHQPTRVANNQGLLSADHTAGAVFTIPCSNPNSVTQENDGNLELTLYGGPDAASVLSYDPSAACAGYSSTRQFNPLAPHPWLDHYSFDPATGHQITADESVVLQGDGGPGDLLALADVNLQISAIGRRSNGAGDFRYQGEIAEILVYDQPSGGADIGALNAYFGAAWNTP